MKFWNIQVDVFWWACLLWCCGLSFMPLGLEKTIPGGSLAAGSGAPWARRGSSLRGACVLAAALGGTRSPGRAWAWRRPAGCPPGFFAGWLSCPHPHCPDISSKGWKSTGEFLYLFGLAQMSKIDSKSVNCGWDLRYTQWLIRYNNALIIHIWQKYAVVKVIRV